MLALTDRRSLVLRGNNMNAAKSTTLGDIERFRLLVAAAITDRTRGDGDGQAGESTHWIPGRSSQRCVVDRSRGSGGRRSPDRLAHQASSSPPTVVNGSRRAQAVHILPRRRARRVDAADTHATWWHSPNSEQGVVLAPATALPSPRYDQGSVTGAPSGEEDAGDMRPWVGRLPATCGSSPPSTTVFGRTSRGCVRSLCWRCSPTTPASARSPAATSAYRDDSHLSTAAAPC